MCEFEAKVRSLLDVQPVNVPGTYLGAAVPRDLRHEIAQYAALQHRGLRFSAWEEQFLRDHFEFEFGTCRALPGAFSRYGIMPTQMAHGLHMKFTGNGRCFVFDWPARCAHIISATDHRFINVPHQPDEDTRWRRGEWQLVSRSYRIGNRLITPDLEIVAAGDTIETATDTSIPYMIKLPCGLIVQSIKSNLGLVRPNPSLVHPNPSLVCPNNNIVMLSAAEKAAAEFVANRNGYWNVTDYGNADSDLGLMTAHLNIYPAHSHTKDVLRFVLQ